MAMVLCAVAGWAQSPLASPTYFEIPSSPYVFMTTPENVKGAYMQGWVCTDAASWQTVASGTTGWYGRWENIGTEEETFAPYPDPEYKSPAADYGFDGMQVRNQDGAGRRLYMYIKNVSSITGYFVSNNKSRQFMIHVYEGETEVKSETTTMDGSSNGAKVTVSDLDATKEYKVMLESNNSNCWVQAVKFEGTASPRLDTHFYLEQTGNVVKVANKAEGETVRYITGTTGRVTASAEEFPANGVSFTPGETLDLRVRAFDAEGTGSGTYAAHFELPVPTITKDYVCVKVTADPEKTSASYDAWKDVYDNTTDVLWTTTAGDYQYIYKVGEDYVKRTTLTGDVIELPAATFNRKNTMYFNLESPSVLKVTAAPYLKGDPATLVTNGTHIQVDDEYYEADAKGNYWVNLQPGVHKFVACKWGSEPGIQMIEIQKGLAPAVNHKIVLDGQEKATVSYTVEPGSKYEFKVERAFSYDYVNYDLISFGDSLINSTFTIDAVEADTTIVVNIATPIVAPTSKLINYYWKSNYYVTEFGGTATTQAKNEGRVNYPNAGYYTISLNGKTDFSGDMNVVINLDKPLAANDTIIVTGYKNKDDASKKSSFKMKANDTEYDTGDVFNNIAIDNQLPNQISIPVSEAMAGASSLLITRGEAGTNLFVTEIIIKTTLTNDTVKNAYADLSVKADSIANRYAWAIDGNEALQNKVTTINEAVAALSPSVEAVESATDEEKQAILDEIARIDGLLADLEAAAGVPQVMSKVAEGEYAFTMTLDELNSKISKVRSDAAWNIGFKAQTGEILYADDDIEIAAGHDDAMIYFANGKIGNIKNLGYTGYANVGTSLAQSDWNEESITNDIKTKGIAGIAKKGSQAIVKVTTKKEGYLSFSTVNWSGKRCMGVWSAADEALVPMHFANDSTSFYAQIDNQNGGGVTVKTTTTKVPAGEYYVLYGGNKNINLYKIDLLDEVPVDPIADGDDIAEYVKANADKLFKGDDAEVELGAGNYTMNSNIDVPTGKSLVIKADDNANIALGENASFVLKGGLQLLGLKIDASKNSAPLISLATEYTAEDSLANYNAEIGRMLLEEAIMITDCEINDVHSYLFYDNSKNVVVSDFIVGNSVIKFNTTDAAVTGKALIYTPGYGINYLWLTNSTFYNVSETGAKYFVQYSNSARADRAGIEMAEVTLTYNTFYNTIDAGGQFANWSGMQNKTSYTVKENIFFGIKDVARRLIGGRTSGQSVYDWKNNTYAYLDGEAVAFDNETSYDTSATALKCDPEFQDAANGDFHIGASTLQAKEKTGDPRWLVEYVEPTSINSAKAEMNSGVLYNIAGQKVDANYRGIVIKNGKKVMVK